MLPIRIVVARLICGRALEGRLLRGRVLLGRRLLLLLCGHCVNATANAPAPQKLTRKYFCCTSETVFHSCMKHVIVPARETGHQMVWVETTAHGRAPNSEENEGEAMTNSTTRPRVNPLSRRPRQQRLVMAVRGGAGVGKSGFVR